MPFSPRMNYYKFNSKLTLDIFVVFAPRRINGKIITDIAVQYFVVLPSLNFPYMEQIVAN